MVALLYNRTCNTLLSSSLRIKQLVSFCVEKGYKAVGIADTNVLYGAMELYHLCKSSGIKPLYGLEISVTIDSEKYPYVLYARNNAGYQELIELSTALNDDLDVVSPEHLDRYKNLITIEIENRGYLEHIINTEDNSALMEYVRRYANRDNFYIGLSSPLNNNYYRNLNDRITHFAMQNHLQTVAMPLSLYATKEDAESYKVLKAIRLQTSVNDSKFSYETDSHLLAQQDIYDLYDAMSVNNTDMIINDCNVDLGEMPKASLPKFITPEGVDSKTYLKSLCLAGLKKRFEGRKYPDSYSNRLNYELKIITEMNYEDYFLIVWDLILFSRRNNIYVGVGRGSAAGSLVAYCLGITHIDPIKYGLLFERFLNPERISMPDIDIDFPDDKREQVIQYVIGKYGSDHIAHIITFNTLAARAVLKDAGKALDVTASKLDLLTKLVDNVPKMTLKRAYTTNKRFNTAVNSSNEFKRLYEIALKLEGLPRHTSIHAAGIVMSDRPLNVNMPLLKVDDSYCTQYTMEYLEEMGLIKMDFLGLKNLSIIAEITENVNRIQPLDILKIPLDDRKTYELISRADTAGVFQLDSDGMKNLLRKLKPTCFDDIAVTIALFRPGPMENIPVYLAARNDSSNIRYAHPDLIPILKETYGVMIYQEQIMQVAQKIAGFSLGKADLLRKAISKKIPDQINMLEGDFRVGALERGYSSAVINEIFEDIKKFANYGFNKSHSVAYGLLAYQLAYLKANFPLQFYMSLLNSVIGSDNKTNEYIVEARRNGIRVLPPDINQSDIEYVIDGDTVRFPLNTIKGIGKIVAGSIVEERRKNGLFRDYFDFVVRCSSLRIGKNIFETLIKSGCLDSFGLSRSTMVNGLDETLRYADLVKVDVNGQIQIDLQLVDKPVLKVIPDNSAINSRYEEELIGFYLSGHPVEKFRQQYPETIDSSVLKTRRGYVKVICKIQKMRDYRTKNGELMCFVDGFDEFGEINMVLMPNVYSRYSSKVRKGCVVFAEGTIDDRLSVKVNNMIILEGGN